MGGNCLSEVSSNKAIYYKQKEYRENGHKYICATENRCDRYARLPGIQKALKQYKVGCGKVRPVADAGQKSHAKRYVFDYEANFTRGKVPYKNQAHHLVPINFVSKITDEQVRQIAMKIEVNLNRGPNIIFLPETKGLSLYHNLPYHCGSHDKYGDQVFDDAKKLTQKLKEYVGNDPCAPEKNLPKGVEDTFDNYSNDLWEIVSVSLGTINAVRVSTVQVNEVDEESAGEMV